MKQNFFIIFLTGFFVASVIANEYHLCRVMPRNSDQLKILEDLQKSINSYRFLNKVQQITVPVFIIVPSFELIKFKNLIQNLHTSCRPIPENMQPDMMAINVADSKSGEKNYSWTHYHQLNDNYNWLTSLAEKYPKLVSVITPGKSFENRRILGLKISFQKKNKAIFIEGGSHGNEWISPAVVNYIAYQILTNKDLKFRSLVEKYDWYIVPHTNPDGYVYTHTTNRFWRKTVSRKNYNNSTCFGVDLNRNWGYHWNENNVASDSCSNIYPGSEKFSEIESRSLSEYLYKIKNKLLLHLTIDGSNQWLFSPFGYGTMPTRNSDDLKRVMTAATNAVKRKFGSEYTNGQMSTELYPISGTSMDWVYGELGVNYSFILQLPPQVKFGQFLQLLSLVPSNKIVSIGEEALYFVVQIIKSI